MEMPYSCHEDPLDLTRSTVTTAIRVRRGYCDAGTAYWDFRHPWSRSRRGTWVAKPSRLFGLEADGKQQIFFCRLLLVRPVDMAPSGLHDPLTINLRRQTAALLSAIPTSYAIVIQNASSTKQLLAILSKLLALPPLTQTIATLYRPILYDLCARWLEDDQNIEDKLVALCLLIQIHEELFPFVYLFSAQFFSLH